MNLMSSMMGNIDGFVDKMDAKVAGVMEATLPWMYSTSRRRQRHSCATASTSTTTAGANCSSHQQAEPQPVPMEPQHLRCQGMKRLPPEPSRR